MDDKTLQQEAARLRPMLLRFARLQLRDEAAAEDAVQECLLAALTSKQGFAGQSALRTWLTAILRNKIVDHIRQKAREPSVQAVDDDGEDRDFDALFLPDGHWAEPPARWGDPHRTLENKRFYDVFEACVEILPAKIARVFMLREFSGLETDEICKELAISTANCWVTLHRARMRLRDCLQLNWFGAEPGGVSV